MPIYEYGCESCGHRLEKLQKMSDSPLIDCPVCEKPALKRLVSAVRFRLKGSGWYETDFKKDNKRNLADSSETNSPTKKSSAKSSSGNGGENTDKSTSQSKPKKPETEPASNSSHA